MKLKAILVIGSVLFCSNAAAQKFDLGTLEDRVFVSKMGYYTDSTAELTVEEIVKKEESKGFRVANHFGNLIGVGEFNYWLVLDVYNSGKTATDVVFEIPIARLDSIKLYSKSASGILHEGMCRGFGATIEDKPLRSYAHAVQVNFPARSSKKLFFLLRKFPGSVRTAIVAYTPTTFAARQRNINSRLSFYLALAIVVLLSSLLLAIKAYKIDYLIFMFLVIVKVSQLLQLFNFTPLLSQIGFTHISNSIFVLLTVLLQYQFFKLYYQEKTAGGIYVATAIIMLLDITFGSTLQSIRVYYVGIYLIVLAFEFLFLFEIFRKFHLIKPIDLLFVGVQVCSLLFLITIILRYNVSFGDDFFRKFDYDALYAISLLEILTFLFYLTIGLLQLNNDRQLKTAALNQLQDTIISIQETERKQIAMDLHDDLGSTLSILKEKINNELPTNSASKELIIKAISDLRSISHNLIPTDFEVFGLVKSLENYVSQLNENGLKVTLITYGETHELPTETELNLYRILSEILHNIKKHSLSKEATVQLIYHKNLLHVSVETNTGEISKDKSVGIGEKAVHSRLEYLKANILEKGTGENGYSYIFEIPYDQNPHRG